MEENKEPEPMKYNQETWYYCKKCARDYGICSYISDKECPNGHDINEVEECPPGTILYGCYKMVVSKPSRSFVMKP